MVYGPAGNVKDVVLCNCVTQRGQELDVLESRQIGKPASDPLWFETDSVVRVLVYVGERNLWARVKLRVLSWDQGQGLGQVQSVPRQCGVATGDLLRFRLEHVDYQVG
jgi:hypothetical protein